MKKITKVLFKHIYVNIYILYLVDLKKLKKLIQNWYIYELENIHTLE